MANTLLPKREQLADEIRKELGLTIPVSPESMRACVLKLIQEDPEGTSSVYIPNPRQADKNIDEVSLCLHSLFESDPNSTIANQVYDAVRMPMEEFQHMCDTHMVKGLLYAQPDYDLVAGHFHVTRRQVIDRYFGLLEETSIGKLF